MSVYTEEPPFDEDEYYKGIAAVTWIINEVQKMHPDTPVLVAESAE
ncbi:unnamed protein product [Schistocephalus solidus]|uniref:Peptidase_M14 domain-containing protein n=1 Tax=Schistocephalus solidus TaxID=70667 RepID=A0A183TSW1_SCHSO|nr:unnamed protein product [Schistocephalus solidus]